MSQYRVIVLIILWSLISLFTISVIDMGTFVYALSIEVKTDLIEEMEINENFTINDLFEKAANNFSQTQTATPTNKLSPFNNTSVSSISYSLNNRVFSDFSYHDYLSIKIWGDLSQVQFLQLAEDKYDPEQSLLQPFISKIKFTIYAFVGFMLSILLGIVFIDFKTFHTTLKNCIRSDRSISYKRTKYEATRLLKYLISIVMIVALFISIHAAILFPIDRYILPIPFVLKIFSVFDTDPQIWEANIKTGIYGDINTEHEYWLMERGYSLASAEFFQFLLWNLWYFIAALLIYFIISLYFIVIKIGVSFYNKYQIQVIRKSHLYGTVDLHRANRIASSNLNS